MWNSRCNQAVACEILLLTRQLTSRVNTASLRALDAITLARNFAGFVRRKVKCMCVVPFKYKVDFDRYSRNSKNSYGLHLRENFYSNITYKCRSCGKLDIFSAIEQKKAYENRQEYYEQKRILCQDCWRSKRRLLKLAQNLEAEYCRNKQAKLEDLDFLLSWFNTLNEYKKYSHRYNHMRIKFLRKHIDVLLNKNM